MRAALAQLCAAALLVIAPFETASSAPDARALWTALAGGGHVAMIRHALAPGIGDPENFRLGDCDTQRDLGDRGRDQARRIGDTFRANNVTVARVLTSEWCRCQDTAKLLSMGDVETFSALNSLYGRQENEETQVGALRAFLRAQPTDGPSLVFVSHNVTIGALTGVYPQSGAIVVVKLTGKGKFDVAGTIPPP